MIEAHPVPVQPPQVPPRPASWAVSYPLFEGDRCLGWVTVATDYEANAQSMAKMRTGALIFRLPGSGEVQ